MVRMIVSESKRRNFMNNTFKPLGDLPEAPHDASSNQKPIASQKNISSSKEETIDFFHMLGNLDSNEINSSNVTDNNETDSLGAGVFHR